MPEPVPAQSSATAARVIAVCEKEWPTNFFNCSGFVNAVAMHLGVMLSGDADDIVDYIESHWRDVGGESFASDWADAGYLVVAGLRGADEHKPEPHGHVAIIVPGTSDNGHALGYWGKYKSVGMKNASISRAWRLADLANVIFRATPIGVGAQ